MTLGKSAGRKLTPVVPSLPVAATTTTFFEIAYSTAARIAAFSSGTVAIALGSKPSDIFIT